MQYQQFQIPFHLVMDYLHTFFVDANAEHKGTAGHVTLNTKDIADYKYRIDILPLLQRAMRLPRLEIHIQYNPSTAYCEPDDDGTEFHDDTLEKTLSTEDSMSLRGLKNEAWVKYRDTALEAVLVDNCYTTFVVKLEHAEDWMRDEPLLVPRRVSWPVVYGPSNAKRWEELSGLCIGHSRYRVMVEAWALEAKAARINRIKSGHANQRVRPADDEDD
jgi:hypothetical protein